MIRRIGLASLLMLVQSGCGLGLMQTAKTVPRGEIEVALAGGYVHNEMVAERGRAFSNFPIEIGLRYGAGEQVDVGISQFMVLGGLADVKYNFLHPKNPLALSLQGGFGAADNLSAGYILHLPLRALVSYDLGGTTPYLGAGFGLYWIRDYKSEDAVPNAVEPKGHGDGLIMLNAGFEFFTDGDVRMLVEYAFLTQVLDDPGDFFSFADNHIFHVGMRF